MKEPENLKKDMQLKKTALFNQRKWLPYLLVSPYLLFVLVFVLFPVLFCLFLTFQKWNIIAPMHFIGVDNHTFIYR